MVVGSRNAWIAGWGASFAQFLFQPPKLDPGSGGGAGREGRTAGAKKKLEQVTERPIYGPTNWLPTSVPAIGAVGGRFRGRCNAVSGGAQTAMSCARNLHSRDTAMFGAVISGLLEETQKEKKESKK